jgi:hypothetical protein
VSYNFAETLKWPLSDFYKGPVVRISPGEVHIDDADYFDSVYNNTNGRMDKPTKVADAFGPFAAVCITCDSRKPRANIMITNRSLELSTTIYTESGAVQ